MMIGKYITYIFVYVCVCVLFNCFKCLVSWFVFLRINILWTSSVPTYFKEKCGYCIFLLLSLNLFKAAFQFRLLYLAGLLSNEHGLFWAHQNRPKDVKSSSFISEIQKTSEIIKLSSLCKCSKYNTKQKQIKYLQKVRVRQQKQKRNVWLYNFTVKKNFSCTIIYI